MIPVELTSTELLVVINHLRESASLSHQLGKDTKEKWIRDSAAAAESKANDRAMKLAELVRNNYDQAP